MSNFCCTSSDCKIITCTKIKRKKKGTKPSDQNRLKNERHTPAATSNIVVIDCRIKKKKKMKKKRKGEKGKQPTKT